jgi:Flp pilus assembly protein TadD
MSTVFAIALSLGLVSFALPNAWAEPATPAAAQSDELGRAQEESQAAESTEASESSQSIEESTAEEPTAEEPTAQEVPMTDEMRQSEAVKHFDLAGFYLRQWKFPMAEIELEEAIANYPDLKAAHRDLCVVSFCQGNILRAVAEMMMTVGLGDPVPLTTAERAELDRKAMTAHYNRGIEQGTNRNWDDAISEFKWALTYAPDDARVHRSLAFAYANAGNFALAEQQYSQSFGLDPNDPYGHADFANVLSDKGEQQRAMSQMSEAIKRAPDAAALHVDMGWMAEASGDMAKASSEFREAVQLSPKHAGLWTHLGRILEEQGKADEALDAYQHALALDPGSEVARTRLLKLRHSVGS